MYRSSPEDAWERLANPGSSTKPFNADVVLDGGITISQKFADPKTNGRDVARWTVRYEPWQYTTLELLHYDVPTSNDTPDRQSAKIHIRCLTISSSKDTSTATGSSVADASKFPINTCSSQFQEIQMIFDSRTSIKNWDYNVALSFLGGQIAFTHNTDGHLFITAQLTAISAEGAANEALLKMQDGCQVRVSIFRESSLLLEIWPPVKPDDVDIDMDTRHLGKRYTISSPILFRPEDAWEYPIPGVAKTETWQAIYVPLPELLAPITALVVNYISPLKIRLWQDKTDSNLCLVPFFDDPSSERKSTATTGLKRQFIAQELEDIQRLIPSLNLSAAASMSLPLRNIFLDNHPAICEDEPFLSREIQIPETFRLNDSQKSGIRNFYRKKVSIIHGPPATGKSHTLARLMQQILQDAPQTKILVCAPTNVAVTEIYKKATSVFTNDNIPYKFVRLYPEAQIESQYIQRDSRVRWDPCHIQRLRALFAARNPGEHADFIQGQHLYEKMGRIADPDIARKYGRSCRELTQMIMSEASIVFCTCTAVALKAISNFPDWLWPASVCLIEEAGCAKPYEILLPLIAVPTIKRLVLAGDPFQLGPTILSDEARQIWRTTTLAKAIDKGWPTTPLDLQYRAHDQLYQHTTEVFYLNRVRSPFTTGLPRPFLAHLLSLLPLNVPINNGRAFKLHSSAHFLDVADGQVETVPGGSSSNLQEALVTQSLVKSLLALPKVSTANILVLTGYRRQAKLLKDLAKQNQWEEVEIRTVDGSQGAERQIVILNTVRTSGVSFMANRNRANLCTSRAREAFYLVGKWQAFEKEGSSFSFLRAVVQSMKQRLPGFVVQAGN
ncbi:Regulator of nonsense transcripts 1-like protein [Acarospora aff. strigata]|nr:Regulator of nonsense transcripts 1-like protein [Acarospora aff. strigata]